jgi:cyclohexyl-isocyanide hydratase
MDTPAFTSGFLLYPGLTQLDLTGPWEVLARLPNSRSLLIAATDAPVRSDSGLSIVPTATFATAPALDLLCVPGGPGTMDAAGDPATLAFVQRAAAGAQFVTSVCTGSLILGAAGLLAGKRAACHWAFRHLLAGFGATPVAERVVQDGNLVTGGGVTAGLDFAFTLMARIAGQQFAELVQLGLEYDPAPPFACGSPERAGAALVEMFLANAGSRTAVK